MPISIDDIRAARSRLDDSAVVRPMPIDSSQSLSELSDATVALKMEHLQCTGSFKTRGAYNKLAQISPDTVDHCDAAQRPASEGRPPGATVRTQSCGAMDSRRR
jgi:threonine dehydratase